MRSRKVDRTIRHTLLSLIALGMSASTSAAQTRQRSARSDRPVWPDEGPATWTQRRTVSAITANDLRTRLYQFADDSMLGRRIGEPGNYKGTDYIAREFKRLGLKPGGDNATYFQNLPYGPAGFDSTTSTLTVAGEPLARKTDWVPVTPTATNNVLGSANLDNVPTVFAGRWGDTATALDAAMFRGKVAVFLASAQAAGLSGRGGQRVLR